MHDSIVYWPEILNLIQNSSNVIKLYSEAICFELFSLGK